MKLKSWHIWDFPDNLYVLIKKEMREEFFQTMYKKFGSQKNYAKFLGKERSVVQGYHYARYWYKGKISTKFTPINILKQSLKYINIKLKKKIENNIISIKGKGGDEIYQPKLPIKESPKFYKIVAHLIGDGNDSHSPYYSNTCDNLIEDFKKDIQIFGKIKCRDNINQQNVKYTNFTKTITYILSYILYIKFTRPNKIPERLFVTSNSCKAYFLQALFDDEGSISTNLSFCMKNYNIIREVKKLIESLDIKTTKISLKKEKLGNKSYAFNINNSSITTFKERINFIHPEKYRKLNIRLKIIERNKEQRTRPLEWSRNEILNLLESKPRGTLELCENLLLTVNGLYEHLNYLEEKGLIKRTGYKNKVIWEVNQGRNHFISQ